MIMCNQTDKFTIIISTYRSREHEHNIKNKLYFK